MSLLWMDGFDSQDLSRWTLSGTPTLVAGRVGGYGVEMNAASEGMGRAWTPSSTITLGFAMKITTIETSDGFTVSLRNAGGNADFCTLRCTGGTGYTVRHYYNNYGGVVTGSVGTLTTGVWEHFEILYTNAASGNITVKRNGTTAFQYTGDTRRDTNVEQMVGLTCTVTGFAPNVVALDDMWVSTGESYGDSRVRGLVPTADSTKGWTASTGTDHYALVDDVPPSMTDYVSATAASGLSDTFTLTVPGDITTVSAVQVNAYGLKTDAGVAPFRVLADGQESADLNFATTATGVSAVFPTAAGSAAWTPAKLAGAGAFGIKAV